jgi:y4mF family transcriptional regulator
LYIISNLLPDMDIKEIGSTIKGRRKFLKITQEDLADISGISERTLRDIEKGLANPELESLMKLCEVLGLKLTISVLKL